MSDPIRNTFVPLLRDSGELHAQCCDTAAAKLHGDAPVYSLAVNNFYTPFWQDEDGDLLLDVDGPFELF